MKSTPKRRVKAWAIVDKEGLMFAQTTKLECAVYTGSGRFALYENVQIVPCEITYSLPKPNKKT